MCDVPNNAVLGTILVDTSLEIDSKCVVRISYLDPSAQITNGTIVTFSRFHNFCILTLQVLLFDYLVSCCAYHIIVLWGCSVNKLCCLFCVIPNHNIVLAKLHHFIGEQWSAPVYFHLPLRGCVEGGNDVTTTHILWIRYSSVLFSVDVCQFCHVYINIPINITFRTQ